MIGKKEGIARSRATEKSEHLNVVLQQGTFVFEGVPHT